MGKRFYLCEKSSMDLQKQEVESEQKFQCDQKQWKVVEIEEAFPFVGKNNRVVSIVGAGGKTTLMEHLAMACTDQKRKVLLTTTTHIWKSEKWPWYPTAQKAKETFSQNDMVVLGKPCTCGKENSSQKLEYPGKEEFSSCMECADITFIEADGARSMPCKAPGLHEPVIPKESNAVVAVIGLGGLGKPVWEVCFRIPQVLQLLQITDGNHCLTIEDYVTLLCSEKGAGKAVGQRDFYVFLNQCDTEELRKDAKRIAIGVRKQLEETVKDIIISGIEQ